MTPQQAVDLLTKATANLRGTRAEHNVINEALATIQEALNPKEATETKD